MKTIETDKPLWQIMEAVSIGGLVGLVVCALICVVLWAVEEGIIY